MKAFINYGGVRVEYFFKKNETLTNRKILNKINPVNKIKIISIGVRSSYEI